MIRDAFWNLYVPGATAGPSAPLLHPDFQRRGIGCTLIETTFEKARAMEHKRVVIFGHAEAFDRQFPPKEKKVQPSQEEFYIYSHSLIMN